MEHSGSTHSNTEQPQTHTQHVSAGYLPPPPHDHTQQPAVSKYLSASIQPPTDEELGVGAIVVETASCVATPRLWELPLH